MTEAQFHLLARLLAVPAPARAAARAVLLDGLDRTTAAAMQGCANRELEQALANIQALNTEIRTAFDPANEQMGAEPSSAELSMSPLCPSSID